MEEMAVDTLRNSLSEPRATTRTENFSLISTVTNSTSQECPQSVAALSNHLILKEIVKYLDTRSILNLSLVNKAFLYTTRSTLRIRKCLALIKSYDPSQDLVLLDEILSESLDPHPYAGLYIKLTEKSFYDNGKNFSRTYSSLQNMTQLHLEYFDEDKYSNFSAQSLLIKHLKDNLPNVREFSFSGVRLELRSLLQLLWTWSELETITLKSVDFRAAFFNMDSIFCGIDSNQAGQYIRRSAESLRDIDFQPSTPSILSLKRLRTLRLEFLHPNGNAQINGAIFASVYPSRFILSHVTGILAFSRLPQLNVVIVKEICGSHCSYNLDHLKPFVTIVDVKLKPHYVGQYVGQCFPTLEFVNF